MKALPLDTGFLSSCREFIQTKCKMIYWAYRYGAVGVNRRHVLIVFFCETFSLTMNDFWGWKGGKQDLMLVSAMNACSVVLW